MSEEAASLTLEELTGALVPVIEAQNYNSMVLCGVIVALGFVAGLLLIRIFLDRF